MRNVLTFLAAVLLASTAHGASPSPPKAPTTINLIACRVDDLTGQKGRHGVDPVTGKFNESSAAKGWRDLELRIEHGVLECKVVPLENLDEVPYKGTNGKSVYSDMVDEGFLPLNPNFGSPAQCARTAMLISPDWDKANPGWSVISVACPSPVMSSGPDGIERNADDYIVDWIVPECPSFFPGTDGKTRIRCHPTPSEV